MFEDKPRKKLAKKVQVRLTPLQWANIAARVRFGESKASLAREYGITRQSIHSKMGIGLQEESPIETAASKIVIAHEYVQSGVKGMHPKLQVEAWDMAKNLISISENLTEGALYGAMNFFKLAKLAQEMTESMLADGIDINTLGAISAITKTANEAAAPSMNLLNINKQTVDRLTKTGDIIGKKTLADFYGIPTLVDDQDKDNK